MEPKRSRSPALERIRRWFPLVLLLLSWADSAVAQTPISLFQGYLGRVNYVATGGSLRNQPNTVNACSLNAASTNNIAGIPAAATIRNAFLYWSGSGSTVDASVTLNGATVNASRTFTATFVNGGTNFDFFSGFADVTAIVTGNGNITFGGLTVNTGAPHCGSQAVLSGWGLIVVYADPAEDLRAVNVFDGFQFFRGNSVSTTLDTFRVPTSPINGQVTHITWEGDPQNSGSLNGFTESLTFGGNLLDDGLVPPNSNPTVQQFDGTVNTTPSITEYGVDVDTYDVSAFLTPGQTSATTIYSSGLDLVLLSAEVMSVTTEPFVDLELTKTHIGDFTAGVNGDYTLTVSNIGVENDAGVTVTDTLPTGLTYVGFAGTDWNCTVAAQDVTCTHPGPLLAGATLPDLTLTVLPDSSGAPSVDNTATVTSLSLDSNPSNNTAVDTTVIRVSDLSTSTKGVVDLNGGDADPGDTLRYTITLIETGGFDALNVSVIDDAPALVNSFSVGTIPPGAVDNSTGAGTGANGNGFLDVSNFTVLANTSVTITFDVNVAAGANPGDIITNQATVTSGNGLSGNPLAPNVIVSQSQIPSGGTKTLYLYDLNTLDPNGFNLGPRPYLSRTPPAGAQDNVTVDRNQPPRVWTMTPATQLPLDIDAGIGIPVTLYVSKNNANGGPVTRTLQVALDTIGATTGPLGTPVTLTFAAPPTGSPIPIVFNIPLPTSVSLATGTQIRITVTNQTAGGGGGSQRVRVFPVSGGNFSRAELPALTVIDVTDVSAFDTAFPGGTTPASFAPGSDVFVRAIVTDPFGSFDIASASLDLIDALGNPQLTGAAMTLVDDDGVATRTYELSYTLPAGAAAGTWTPRVTAIEGIEGVVTSILSAAFDVVSLAPDLVVVKTVTTLADPVNLTTNPKAIPGATMLYTLGVTNQGPGTVDAGSLRVTDILPANIALFVDTSSGDPIVFIDGTPTSGLGYTFISDVSFSDQVGGGAPYDHTLAPDGAGFDGDVTGILITPSGSMAPDIGAGSPSFQLRFRVRVD